MIYIVSTIKQLADDKLLSLIAHNATNQTSAYESTQICKTHLNENYILELRSE